MPAASVALPAPAAADRHQALARRARMLSWAGLVWIGAEGAVAVAAGLAAGSVALVGFGVDSAIEAAASLVVIWRFTGSRTLSEAAERRAQRFVAVQFFLLAPYVAVAACAALIAGERPDPSWVGVALAATSAAGMPLLGVAKRRVGEQLGSRATRGEGMQNVLCGFLAGALLVGLLANALAGLWWLDPGVGLLIAGVAVREGVGAWRGDGTCSCAA